MVVTPERVGFENDLARLLNLFSQAENRVEREMLTALRRDRQYTASQRRAKLREIRSILSELRELALTGGQQAPDAPAWDVVRSAYRGGSDAAIESMAAAGVEGIETAFSGIHQDTAEVLYENLAGRIDDAVAYVGRRAEDAFREVALEEVLAGTIEGWSRRDTSEAIAERLESRGIKAFRDRRGAEWSLANYAEMTARTVAREAHTQGTVNRLAENGLDLVQISEHSHEHDVCSQYEGKIYSISGNHPLYPAAAGNLPPYHPRCVHVATPYIEEFAS